MTTQTATTEILQSLFREFEQRNVPYCVLRNYERLPYEVGNDIDVLIEEASQDLVAGIVQECAEKHGWTLRRRGHGLYLILYRLIEGSWVFFRLDIVTKLRSGGLNYFPADSFIRSASRRDNGLLTPAPTLEFFHVFPD